MALDVLEILESSVKNFGLTDLLQDYVEARQREGHLSLHDFLAYTEAKKYGLSRSAFAARALRIVGRGYRHRKADRALISAARTGPPRRPRAQASPLLFDGHALP